MNRSFGALHALCTVENAHRGLHPRSQLILAMRLDCHVGSGICYACEAEAVIHLVVVQESLIRLIDGTLKDFAGTAGTRTRTAGIGELQAFLLGLIQDVDVLLALELLRSVRSLQCDLEVRSDPTACGHRVDYSRHGSGGQAGPAAALHGPAVAVDCLCCPQLLNQWTDQTDTAILQVP